MRASKDAVWPHTAVVLSIVPTLALLLLVFACSRQDSAQATSGRRAVPESSGESGASAPALRSDEGGPVSPGCEKCSPEAEAAFKRLRAAQAGDRRQVSRDVLVLARSCEAGVWDACNGLGVVYGEGHGIEPNPAKAVGYFRRACDGGNAMGCLNLALLYRSGTGVHGDLSEAARFLEKACTLGNFFACESLAVTHASGRGVPKDFTKAASFYKKACDGGASPGCTNLGALYETGAGVEKDREKAKTYYARGCELGEEVACEAAKRLR